MKHLPTYIQWKLSIAMLVYQRIDVHPSSAHKNHWLNPLKPPNRGWIWVFARGFWNKHLCCVCVTDPFKVVYIQIYQICSLYSMSLIIILSPPKYPSKWAKILKSRVSFTISIHFSNRKWMIIKNQLTIVKSYPIQIPLINSLNRV